MGYRIVYGEEPTAGRTGHLGLWTAAFLLVFVMAVRLTWPLGTEYLREVLVPEERTVEAFAQMVEGVGNGRGMGEAVTAFCQTVVAHGLAE